MLKKGDAFIYKLEKDNDYARVFIVKEVDHCAIHVGHGVHYGHISDVLCVDGFYHKPEDIMEVKVVADTKISRKIYPDAKITTKGLRLC